MTGTVPPPSPSPSIPRYHSLDALRAIMMLLGLVLHTAVNYLPAEAIPESQNWPYHDARTNLIAFGLLIQFIHAFRMPVFFLVAGFFAAFVYGRRGVRAFLEHRLARIGLPMLCAWPILYLALVGTAPWAQSFSAAPEPHPVIAPGVHLLHLWFLYHLLIFCAFAPLVAGAVERAFRADLRQRGLNLFESFVRSRWGLAALGVISAISLLPMETWQFDADGSLLPALHVLAGYAVFFVFGWLLFHRRDLLQGFEPRAWRRFGAGMLCFIVYVLLFDQGFSDPTNPGKELLYAPWYAPLHEAGLTEAAQAGTHALAMLFLALSIWLLTYSFLGLFLRHLERASPIWRYMSDASYWMYLIHLPLAVWVPIMLRDAPLPSGIKFGLSLAGVTAITLITYHYLVRSTFIGRTLNGRRYPRIAPWRTAA